MTLRDDISNINDEARFILQDLDMRYYVVVIEADPVTPPPPAGIGILAAPPVLTQTLIQPNPRVRTAPRNEGDEVGLIQAGDIIVDRVSRINASESAIRGSTYRINPTYDPVADRYVGGDRYRPVSVEVLHTQYRVVLRRMTR